MSQEIHFEVQGMDCAEEVAALKAVLGPLPGIETLRFDVLQSKMIVVGEASITPEKVMSAVAQTGMKAVPWQDTQSVEPAAWGWQRWGRTTMTAVSGLFLLVGLLTHVKVEGWRAAFMSEEGTRPPTISLFFYLGAAIAGAWFVIPKAWRALLQFRPDMNLLMTIAVAGAIGIGQALEGATVALLFAISLALESWSVGRARRAVAALMSLSPDQARVLEANGTETLVIARTVKVNSTVVVRPGEKFPLDGKIIKGETTVNQAPITGESMPVAKQVNSEVFAGTINHDGAVEVITTKPAEDTTLARIARLVGDAQSRRSPSEQWVEQFARYYTPTVMVLAILVMVGPPLILGAQWSQWFYQGLVLLVIACPCALVISTPVSIVAALTSSARQGVLIKGGPFMEAPAKVQAVALDKTGTLTVGHPEVRAIHPLSGHTAAEVLEIAAAVEMRSEHPLAAAIVRTANAQNIQPSAASDYQAMKGKGATARIGDKLIWIGSHRLLEERGQETPEMHAQLESIERQGLSVVVVGKEEHVCGLISVGDQIRPLARNAVQALRTSGIRHIAMLTGDNRGTAEAIGREAGVDEIRAELLPEDKVRAIEDLSEKYGRVAMVGDGVNDAPALARSSLGIAMGVAGTDAALETADIALMGDDLMALPWLIGHARRTLSVIRQNIAASLGVKALFLALTLTGHATLWAAIAADTGVSLLVVFNGLRLLKPGKLSREQG